MSDTHVWPAPALVDDALLELSNYRKQLRYLVHEFSRDDPRRELLDAVWGSLEGIEKRMREVLTAPLLVEEHRREPGVDTGAWHRGVRGFLTRNQRPR